MARFCDRRLAVIVLCLSVFVEGSARRKREKQWTEEDESRRIEQIKKAEQMEYQTEQSLDYGGQEAFVRAPEKMWCYHCASPMQSVGENMRIAIRSFFNVRRTEYPSSAVHPDCTEPRNLTSLQKQYCLHSYCQTLVLTDHDTGSFFTIRGCAEKFGAINEELLRRQGDNSCHRLHDRLDIQECICRNRKYCYPGADKKNMSPGRVQLSSILAIFALMICRFV